MLLSGTDRPTLDDLVRHVTPCCALKWKDIGRRLDIRLMQLKLIDHDNDGDINKCCNSLWSRWLDADPDATWEKLIFAVGMLFIKLRILMT